MKIKILVLLVLSLGLLAGGVEGQNVYELQSISTTAQPASPANLDAYWLPVAGLTGADWPGNEGKIAWFIQGAAGSAWFFKPPDIHIVYTVVDLNFRKMLWAASQSKFIDTGASFLNRSRVAYVDDSFGNDANTGRDIHSPKKTIQAAIGAVSSLATYASPSVVMILDAQRYIEDIQIPSFVSLVAPNASLTGSITLGQASTVRLNVHHHSGAGAAVDRTVATTQTAFYRVNRTILNSPSTGVRNTVAGTVLHVDTRYVGCGTASEYAVKAAGGDIILQVEEIVLELDDTWGVGVSGGSTLWGTAGRVYERGGQTGTKAFDVDGAGDELRLRVFEADADTLYDVGASGLFRMHGHSFSGVKTVDATADVQEFQLEDGLPSVVSAFPTIKWDGRQVIHTGKQNEVFTYRAADDIWVGQTTFRIIGGGNTLRNNEYTGTGISGIIFSATVGEVVPFNCIPVSISGVVGVADTHTVHARASGVEIAGTDLTFSETTVEFLLIDTFTIVTEGSVLSIFVEDGGGDNFPGHMLTAVFKRAEPGS